MRVYFELEKKMTLKEFVDWMKRGADFVRPYIPNKIGSNLEEVLKDYLNDDREVVVRFFDMGEGDGPNFHYVFRWEIEGVSLPEFLRKKSQYIAEIKDNGFVVQVRA